VGQAAELEACAARLSQAISAQNQQLYKQRPKLSAEDERST